MNKLFRRLVPDTCRRQLHRAAAKNHEAIQSVLCTLTECAPEIVREMKRDRRHAA